MVDLLFNILIILVLMGGIFTQLIGILTVFYWIKTPPKENDDSNRINNIKSWWIGLTRPNVLGSVYKTFQDDVLKQLDQSNKHD